MLKIFHDLVWAAGLLTRFPVGRILPNREARLAKAIWCFPLIGGLIGLIAGGALMGATAAGLPSILCVLVGLFTGVIITGALHEDGLADFSDGLGVSGRARILAVMRDSQIGTFGVLGLGFSLLWRGFALYELSRLGQGPAALIVMHVAGRGVLFPLMLLPLADEEGLAFQAHGGRDPGRFWDWAGWMPGLIALIFSLLIVFAMFSMPLAFAVMGAGLIVSLFVALTAMKRLGGLTGDVYGAAEQGAEMATLAALLVMLG